MPPNNAAPIRHGLLWAPGRAMTVMALVIALALAGCAAGKRTVPGQPATRRANQRESLKGVCPDPIVIQSDWWPQAEEGPTFSLLGQDAQVDAGKKTVTGRLVAHGVDTGVRLQIRAGGPANGFTPAAKLVEAGQALLGTADLDQVIQFSSDPHPVEAVLAPMDISPVVLMWDRTAYPRFRSVQDIGRSGVRVLSFPGATYMEYLLGTGILHRSQVEASYDGTPSRFLTDRGKHGYRDVQQGFITNEVYQYAHELRLPGGKPLGLNIGWVLVNTQYPVYPEAYTVRRDRTSQLAPCLRKLVPDLQRAIVDYLANPKPTNDLIVKLVSEFRAFPYSAGQAANATSVMKARGIMGNGPNATIGDFDSARVADLFGKAVPVLRRQRIKVPDSLQPGDLYTNEFIDHAIGLRS